MRLRPGWLLAFALGCGGPSTARPSTPPHATVPVAEASPEAPEMTEPPVAQTLDERAEVARADLGDRVLDERAVEGATEMHLVLDAGRCYRVVALLEGPGRVELRDEHGHPIAIGEAPDATLSPVCPRWSGSFVLAIESAGRAVLYVAGEPDASGAASSSTASSAR